MKKSAWTIVLLTTIVLFVSLALAACGKASNKGDLFFQSNGDGTCSISKNGSNLKGDLVIPEVSPNGDRVTGIEYRAFRDCTGLTSVTIPDSVTKIGLDAFSGCTGLTAVYYTGDVAGWCGISFEYNGNPLSYAHKLYINSTLVTNLVIPDGVSSIGDFAFSGCSELTSITIPDSVTSIREGAFSGCSSLESITIPFVEFRTWVADHTYQYPFGYIFGERSYTGSVATSQTYYRGGRDGSTYTDITYYLPSSLKSVTVTGGNILYGAFYNCSGLTSVTIGNGVTSIGNSVFSGCSGLTSVTIGSGVTSIGEDAFISCSGLTEVTWNATNCTTAETGFHPSFSCCPSLTTVTFGDNVESIPAFAFYGCSGLTSVTIPDSVTSIGEYAFTHCSGLTAVTIGNGVTSIGGYAFWDCSKLTSVTIGNSVTSIGNAAFSGCSKLTSVTIPESVTTIESYAFSGCSGLTSILVKEGNVVFHSSGNCLIETASKTLIQGCKTSAIPIDGSVTSIGRSAFSGCSGLTSVTIPDSVTSIGNWAFYGCSGLTSITIPDSVTSIGNWAFEDCSSLTSVTIPNSVTSIGEGAFRGCSTLTSVTIPDSVTTIKSYAFYNCSGLTSVTFVGTKAQWNAISKASDWNYNTGSYTIHCTDGDIAK